VISVSARRAKEIVHKIFRDVHNFFRDIHRFYSVVHKLFTREWKLSGEGMGKRGGKGVKMERKNGSSLL
jgi:hypothetical protein